MSLEQENEIREIAIAANSGEATPPCGVPAIVGKSLPFSTNPALSHCRKTSRSIGTCSNSH